MLGLVSGCIREDLSECNPGVLLKFDYSLNTEYTNLFGDEVDKVTVYVFDGNGYYYDRFTDGGSHLTNGWEMRLPLPPGNYATVTWGGALGSYRVGETNDDETAFQAELKKGVTRIDNFMLTAEKDGQPLGQLDALWHGKKDVVSVSNPETAATVDLMKDTKLLTVTVYDPTIGSGNGSEVPYEAYCTGTNARYLANNAFGKKARPVTNLPYKTYTRPGKRFPNLTCCAW